MAGISILIVDDDKLLVEKLKNTIDWSKLEISMVFTAFNIRQARMILEEYTIQILLCDIDMPQGNGLELLEWIRERKFDVECVFLSSYANFAYAQLALKLSSRDYLLKPISNANLEVALSAVVQDVKDKQQNTYGNQGAILETLWAKILQSDAFEENIEKLLSLELYTKKTRIRIMLVKVWDDLKQETNKKELISYNNAIRNYAERFFNEISSYDLDAVVPFSDSTCGLVIRYTGNPENSTDIAESWIRFMKKRISKQVGIYYGDLICPEYVKESWERLWYMEKNGVIEESGILLEADWFSKGGCYQIPAWHNWEKDMVHSNQLVQVQNLILDYIEEQQKNYGWRKNSLGMFLWDFRMMIYKYLDGQGVEADEIFDPEEYSGYVQNASESMKGIKEFVYYVFEKLEGNRSCNNRQENVIDTLKLYIEQHIGDNLSRSILAKQVYLSEDYVSKMFMKATGMSITNYIALRRIEKAKEYLRNTVHPVSRIATEVGYSNFSYFSKTFREQVGCTPNEYRSRITKNSDAKRI